MLGRQNLVVGADGRRDRVLALDRLVLRELLCGTTRLYDLRRGVPLRSPSLLSKRLNELEEAGVIVMDPTAQPGVFEYRLTQAGEDLRPVIMSLGAWGQRWVESSLTLKNPFAPDGGRAPLARSHPASQAGRDPPAGLSHVQVAHH